MEKYNNLILEYYRTFCVFSGLSDLMMMGPLISPSGDECQECCHNILYITSNTLSGDSSKKNQSHSLLSSVACGTLINKNEICMLQFDKVVCLEPFANKRNKLNHFLISYKMNKK